MIYLFHGSDVEKVRAQAFAWVAAARKKEPNLAYVRLAREEISPAVLHDIASVGGLFVKRILALLDEPFPLARKTEGSEDGEEDAEEGSSSVFEEYIELLASSDNAIVVLAPKLSAPRLKKLSAKAVKVYTFDAKKQAEIFGFNAPLVNALAARDGKKLWLEVVKSLRAGDAPEMLHGLLHWKARDILEKGARLWKPSEARALSLNLISLLQNSRRTGATLAGELEKFALSV